MAITTENRSYRTQHIQNKKLTALQAKEKAQHIAFAPVVFKVALALRNLKILLCLENAGIAGLTLEEIQRATSVSRYGLNVLLECGVQTELITKEDNHYYLTTTGYFFTEDQMTIVNTDFVNDVCYRALDYLEQSILLGQPVGLREFGNWKTIYEGLSQLPSQAQKSWFAFDHFYSDDVLEKVIPIVSKQNPKHILDIGGNTGKFAIEYLNKHSKAVVTIVDLPGQLEMAKRNALSLFLSGKLQLYACDILQYDSKLPAGADVIWMSQFLDCFSENEVVFILEKCRAVMTKTTILYILEPLTDVQRFDAAAFVVQLTSVYFTVAANGNSRMYSATEMKDMISRAGLEILFMEKGLGICQTLIACRIESA
jgi:ubiquinone/menaquinone biosynthesis C-methylase UbiE